MQHTNHFYIRNLAGKVDELLGKNAIDLVVGDALKLGGDTVEVKFSVREKDKADTVIAFVAHYHADATGASTAAPQASQWHLKKWTNNWACKDLDPSETKYPKPLQAAPEAQGCAQQCASLQERRAALQTEVTRTEMRRLCSLRGVG